MESPQPLPSSLAAVLLMVASACTAAQAQITCTPGQTSGIFPVNSVTEGVDVFDSSCASLTFLEIDTVLPTLPVTTLEPLTNLRFLDIDDSLQTLPVGFFDTATTLSLLTLTANDLTELPLGIFDPLTNLSDLLFAQNDLTELPPGIFDSLVNLTQLDSRQNALSQLSFDLFEQLAALKKLDLSINPLLECIPPNNAISVIGPPVCSAPLPPSPPSPPSPPLFPPTVCPPPTDPGDIDNDGQLTIGDLVALVNLVVGQN